MRTLRKNPGSTAIAVAMLALGIGINAAVFSVINAALFEGWPLVHRNDRIVADQDRQELRLLSGFRGLEGAGQVVRGDGSHARCFPHSHADSGAPETYFTTQVTANIFQLLGVRPILGRDFLPSDEKPGAEPVLILRYEVWVRRFGANPAIAGKTVRIDGMPATVIGVMPKGFSFPYPYNQDLWTPMVPTPAALKREIGYAPYAFARLADGATIESARAEMETIGRSAGERVPAHQSRHEPRGDRLR